MYTMCCTFVNIGEMPIYIKQINFDLWLNRFISSAEALGLEMTYFKPNLEIEFSNEPKTKNYGSYSIDEIKNMIRQKWKMDKKTKSILHNINDYNDYRHGEYESLAGAIRDINPGTNYHDICEEIDGWFDNIMFSTPILGEYTNVQKKIIFYTTNIENDNLSGRNVAQNFEKVFAHELFHAYHYCPDSRAYDQEELIRRYDYTIRVVKESLASAFEWYYCTSNRIPGEDELKASWYNHSVWTYPYSGASNVFGRDWRTNAYSINNRKFIDIYQKSIEDMDVALRNLLDKSDFYNIKNAIAIRNKTIKKDVPITCKISPGSIPYFV